MSNGSDLKGLVGFVMIKVKPGKEKEFYDELIEKVNDFERLSRETGIAVFGVTYLFGWYDIGLICGETKRFGQSYDLREFILEEIRNDGELGKLIIDTATVIGETLWVPKIIKDVVGGLSDSHE